MTTTTIDRFFKNEDIRLLKINENSIYIKRVYADYGIIFECVDKEVITTLDDINQVRAWIDNYMSKDI